MKESIRNLLVDCGEDPERDGLIKTPERVEKSMKFLTSGYNVNVEELVNNAIFDVQYDEMVIVRDMEIYSLCEHHLIPFFGKCSVAYIPREKVLGLSKIPRIVDVYARRLQVQERLTVQIAQCLQELLNPKGVAVIIDALHLCMAMRGVQKQNSSTITSSMLGAFKEDPRTRNEFMSLVK
ncbi:MAG: GTP cyclohydrolase I FolE [Nitrospinae bacterium]|nr:GTP cyclohydrolase I FolE [Nitrospinota bacterium]